jgi:hypothetical protein
LVSEKGREEWVAERTPGMHNLHHDDTTEVNSLLTVEDATEILDMLDHHVTSLRVIRKALATPTWTADHV